MKSYKIANLLANEQNLIYLVTCICGVKKLLKMFGDLAFLLQVRNTDILTELFLSHLENGIVRVAKKSLRN